MPTPEEIIEEVTYDVAAHSSRFKQSELKQFPGILLGPNTASAMGANLSDPELKLLRNDLNAFITSKGGTPIKVGGLKATMSVCDTEKLVGAQFTPAVKITC